MLKQSASPSSAGARSNAEGIAKVEDARRRRVLADERRLVLTRALHKPPTTLSERLVQLRQQAEACRAQAIILNAKLAMLERDRSDVRAVREQLVESSAKLDHAVEDITTACERRPRASLRP